jgi:hypothetical protein
LSMYDSEAIREKMEMLRGMGNSVDLMLLEGGKSHAKAG